MLQKVHFRLSSVAQKRCCLSSVLTTLILRLYSTTCIESGFSDDNFCENFGLHVTQISSFKDSEFKDFCMNFCLCSVFSVFIEKKYASLKGEVRGNPDPP